MACEFNWDPDSTLGNSEIDRQEEAAMETDGISRSPEGDNDSDNQTRRSGR